jgi:hypothetical protein
MLCKACGQQVSIASTFCSRCGKRLPGEFQSRARGSVGSSLSLAGYVGLVAGRATRKFLDAGPRVWFAAAVLLVLIIIISVGISLNTAERPIETTSDIGSISYQKAQRLLTEQKTRAAAVTQEAASILTSDAPASRVKQLYKNRWNEIGKIRAGLLLDKSLDAQDRDRIDSALQQEQESVTRILSTYRDLYGE